MAKQVVAVIGGTGLQGGGVVDALLGAGKFAVRVASRNPASDAARALAARGVEVVKADLLDPGSLRSALEGAHGAFVVTNFWDPAQMPRETEIGTAAVKAARAAGVKHLIWSTLPDSDRRARQGRALHGKSPRRRGSQGGRIRAPHVRDGANVLPELPHDDGARVSTERRPRLGGADRPVLARDRFLPGGLANNRRSPHFFRPRSFVNPVSLLFGAQIWL